MQRHKSAFALFHHTRLAPGMGSREYKINLINSINPEWKDLYDDLMQE